MRVCVREREREQWGWGERESNSIIIYTCMYIYLPLASPEGRGGDSIHEVGISKYNSKGLHDAQAYCRNIN